MRAIQPLLLSFGLLAGAPGAAHAAEPDLAQLGEMLHDRQHPRGQSQAALLLIRSTDPEAERLVREGLRNHEEIEVFLALASAVRTCPDERFLDELTAALAVPRAAPRQAAAEALAVLPGPGLVERLRGVAEDERGELAVRQTAVWALGRCGRKQAAGVLVGLLTAPPEALRHSAADALADLTGQAHGADAARWQDWWERTRETPNVRWLEGRLARQTSRADRLEGDLEQAHSQVLRLHQQLYGRVPVAERPTYLQTVADQEDAAVRGLAVSWSLELLPAADAAVQQQLAQLLLHLSQDGALEVQRAAVLGLGRLRQPAVFPRLESLLTQGRPPVRAAAARSLAALARGDDAGMAERQCKVVALLQRALGDPALDVVIEAAEDLGALGAQEVGPVLTGLLHHSSEHVRLAAAQALERVAEPAVLDGLLDALNDPAGTVRFSLVGALARAASPGRSMNEQARARLLARLESLLLEDADPGVRSRAATALGDCAAPEQLPALWKCVLTGEDARLQEKAWAAFVEIQARAANARLLHEWDQLLTTAKQGPRRVRLLTELADRWQKKPELQPLAAAAQEALIAAYLDIGKWAAASPLIRAALTRPGSDAEVQQRLHWLLSAGEQALKEGHRPEALKAVHEAQPFLGKSGDLAEGFAKLSREAAAKD